MQWQTLNGGKYVKNWSNESNYFYMDIFIDEAILPETQDNKAII